MQCTLCNRGEDHPRISMRAPMAPEQVRHAMEADLTVLLAPARL
jgi:hypothetical protein